MLCGRMQISNECLNGIHKFDVKLREICREGMDLLFGSYAPESINGRLVSWDLWLLHKQVVQNHSIHVSYV